MNTLQPNTSEKALLLELACNHEMYGTFHVLSTEHNIEECIEKKPKLFILFHVTNIKYYMEKHSQSPNTNILSDNLDSILQSMYYLIPQFQPQHIQSLIDNSWTTPIETGYSSIFYELHQEIKIQSILRCNQAQYIRDKLIAENFKLDPDSYDFRHIDISKDIESNNDINFDLVDLIETLVSINKKNSKNEEKNDIFIKSHSFNTFQTELYQFIHQIQEKYCSKMSDTLYCVNTVLSQNAKQNEEKNKHKTKDEYMSKLEYYTKPKPVSISNNNDNTKEIEYKIGMRVKIRGNNKNQNKNKNDCNAYIWRIGKIIRMNKNCITVDLEDIDSGHMRIKDFSRIIPIIPIIHNDENQDDENQDDEDDDIIMIEKEKKNDLKSKKRPKRNCNLSVQSAPYQRGRRFWEQNEDKALKAGIVKYKKILYIKTPGVRGIWSKIKEDDQFKDKLKHRTPKMLYDRFRVYEKKGNLPDLS